MRILITTPVFPPDLGGPATFVPLFASYLSSRGHELQILTFSGSHGRFETDAGYSVSRIARNFLPLRYVRWAVQVFRLARCCDLVFCCEHPRVFTVLPTRLRGRALVLRMMVDTAWEQSFRMGLTTDSPEAFRERPRRGLERLFQRLQVWSLKNADAVVAVSRHLAATAVGMGARPDRVWVSYNLPARAPEEGHGVEETGFQNAGAFRILVVARLVPWKGVAAILDAVERLSRDASAPAVDLVVLGDGPCRPELQRRIDTSLALDHRARLLGAVSPDSVRRHMEAADLLILNSQYEGLSHVLLEAFDAGLPVLVAENPGNLELVTHRHSGEVFACDDVDAMLDGVRRLSSEPERLRTYTGEARRQLETWRSSDPFRRLEERFEQLLRADGSNAADTLDTEGASKSAE